MVEHPSRPGNHQVRDEAYMDVGDVTLEGLQTLVASGGKPAMRPTRSAMSRSAGTAESTASCPARYPNDERRQQIIGVTKRRVARFMDDVMPPTLGRFIATHSPGRIPPVRAGPHREGG